MVAQFTVKTTNSERAVYFLSLMSCSINKLKSRMLLTCTNFIFFDFTSKKNLLHKMVVAVVEGGLPPCPPFPLWSCVLLNKLLQIHCGYNQESKFFFWFHILHLLCFCEIWVLCVMDDQIWITYLQIDDNLFSSIWCAIETISSVQWCFYHIDLI